MRKTVAFLIHNIYGKGGTERVTSMLANLLADSNYNVIIISDIAGEEANFTISKKIKIYHLPGENIKSSIIRKFINFNSIGMIIQKNSVSLIINVDVTMSLYTLPYKRKTKIISWEHFNFYSEKNSKIRQISRKLAAKYSDALVVLSDADLKNYKENLKYIKKIIRIYNPVSFNNKRFCDLDNKMILAVGRLEEQKGFDILLEIWSDVCKKTDWKLRIVGEGSKRDELLNIISKNKIKNVEICPFTSKIEEEYLSASILAFTSRYEGFGLVLTEAQSKGLPIVAFDCPEGPREILENGKSGILIPMGDQELFKTELIGLINNLDRMKLLQKTELIRSQKYFPGIILKQWVDLIESI